MVLNSGVTKRGFGSLFGLPLTTVERYRSAAMASQIKITAPSTVLNAVIGEPVLSIFGHDLVLFARSAWRFCFSGLANSSTWSACARLPAASLRFA